MFFINQKGQLAHFNKFLKTDFIYNGIRENPLCESAIQLQEKDAVIFPIEKASDLSNQPTFIRLDFSTVYD
jgi:hypothetical protein